MADKMRLTYIKFILIVCAVVFCMCDTVMATTTEMMSELPQAINEKKEAAVKIIVYVVDQNKKQYNLRQGTGILVETRENDGASSEIVLTNDRLTQVDDTELNNIRLKYGLSAEASLDVCVDIVLQVGTRIEAEIKHEGEDFLVLELKKDINVSNSLNLGNSAAVNANDRLYMLGYGGNMSILGQEDLTNMDLRYGTGAVSAVAEEEIVTDFQPQPGDIGMPVLNANGYVVGMLVERETGICIKPIDTIKKTLDVLGIPYVGISIDNHYNEVTKEIAHQLDILLLECQNLAMDEDAYTKKSIDKLKTAIDSAMEIQSNNESTYDQYEKAIEELEKYKGKLKKKDHPIRMLQLGFATAILFFLILGFRTQRTINQLQEENRYNLGGNTNSNEVIYAKLIRMDSLQEIAITNVIFKIGKHAPEVDYVITDNTSVSRHHADIMRKGKEFFILDNNSTNHTFVNGEQIISGQYVPIKGGDMIRLSDVDFRFEI
ncbi:MAG: FHA domain-containing protein [Lachnospiraceae bacterium]|nr:FHA domain-containing protein [Lachnospiraceae bacterium]